MVRTLQEVLEDDLESQIADGELDDAIWLALSERITVPSDLQRFEFPVTVYYASRLLQWEVGNGGFAQAAFNVREWFELAAMAYRQLGKTAAESIILEVKELLPDNEEVARQLRIGEIEWEEYFVDNDFAVYDDRAYATEEWEIDTERIAYVRVNREAFKI